MRNYLLFLFCLVPVFLLAQQNAGLKKRDWKKDVELLTTEGTIVLRLYDCTPLHRDNFLTLVKSHYYDSILFHRVIKDFVIQAGDPNSKYAQPGKPLGNGGPGYTIPAEFRVTLFHKKRSFSRCKTG